MDFFRKPKSGSDFHKSPDFLPSDVKNFSYRFLLISIGRIVEDGSHSPEAGERDCGDHETFEGEVNPSTPLPEGQGLISLSALPTVGTACLPCTMLGSGPAGRQGLAQNRAFSPRF